MLKNFRCTTVLSCVALVTVLLILPASAAEIPSQLPDPDGKSADMSRPVKVFILLGQSNMLGFGRVGPADQQGTLEYMIKEKGEYQHLVDDEPSGQGYHYNQNAETHMEVGNALGRAMAELLQD
jgi:hypothetical protein